MDRSEHSIEDELVFSSHDGYIFHDSSGFESGDDKELGIVQDFVRQKSGEKRLADRLHAIWYCIPMDNQRPGLDLKYFKDICPDQNVPVIGVFTKFDQFKLNVEMHLEDHPNENTDSNSADVGDKRFEEDYRRPLGEGARFVRLEKMHKTDGRCDKLIEETAGALNDDVVTLMLLAVQRSNVELSVKLAVTRVHPHFGGDADDFRELVKTCLTVFPYLWLYCDDDDNFFDLDDLDLLLFDFDDDDDDDLDDDRIKQIMSMSIMKKVSISRYSIFMNKFFTARNTRHHLVIALISIMKQATTLRPSGLSSQSALAQAELGYQKSNIHSQTALYFPEAPQQYSVQQYVDFIMDAQLCSTDIK